MVHSKPGAHILLCTVVELSVCTWWLVVPCGVCVCGSWAWSAVVEESHICVQLLGRVCNINKNCADPRAESSRLGVGEPSGELVDMAFRQQFG